MSGIMKNDDPAVDILNKILNGLEARGKDLGIENRKQATNLEKMRQELNLLETSIQNHSAEIQKKVADIETQVNSLKEAGRKEHNLAQKEATAAIAQEVPPMTPDAPPMAPPDAPPMAPPLIPDAPTPPLAQDTKVMFQQRKMPTKSNQFDKTSSNASKKTISKASQGDPLVAALKASLGSRRNQLMGRTVDTNKAKQDIASNTALEQQVAIQSLNSKINTLNKQLPLVSKELQYSFYIQQCLTKGLENLKNSINQPPINTQKINSMNKQADSLSKIINKILANAQLTQAMEKIETESLIINEKFRSLEAYSKKQKDSLKKLEEQGKSLKAAIQPFTALKEQVEKEKSEKEKDEKEKQNQEQIKTSASDASMVPAAPPLDSVVPAAPPLDSKPGAPAPDSVPNAPPMGSPLASEKSGSSSKSSKFEEPKSTKLGATSGKQAAMAPIQTPANKSMMEELQKRVRSSKLQEKAEARQPQGTRADISHFLKTWGTTHANHPRYKEVTETLQKDLQILRASKEELEKTYKDIFDNLNEYESAVQDKIRIANDASSALKAADIAQGDQSLGFLRVAKKTYDQQQKSKTGSNPNDPNAGKNILQNFLANLGVKNIDHNNYDQLKKIFLLKFPELSDMEKLQTNLKNITDKRNKMQESLEILKNSSDKIEIDISDLPTEVLERLNVSKINWTEIEGDLKKDKEFRDNFMKIIKVDSAFSQSLKQNLRSLKIDAQKGGVDWDKLDATAFNKFSEEEVKLIKQAYSSSEEKQKQDAKNRSIIKGILMEPSNYRTNHFSELNKELGKLKGLEEVAHLDENSFSEAYAKINQDTIASILKAYYDAVEKVKSEKEMLIRKNVVPEAEKNLVELEREMTTVNQLLAEKDLLHFVEAAMNNLESQVQQVSPPSVIPISPIAAAATIDRVIPTKKTTEPPSPTILVPPVVAQEVLPTASDEATKQTEKEKEVTPTASTTISSPTIQQVKKPVTTETALPVQPLETIKIAEELPIRQEAPVASVAKAATSEAPKQTAREEVTPTASTTISSPTIQQVKKPVTTETALPVQPLETIKIAEELPIRRDPVVGTPSDGVQKQTEKNKEEKKQTKEQDEKLDASIAAASQQSQNAVKAIEPKTKITTDESSEKSRELNQGVPVNLPHSQPQISQVNQNSQAKIIKEPTDDKEKKEARVEEPELKDRLKKVDAQLSQFDKINKTLNNYLKEKRGITQPPKPRPPLWGINPEDQVKMANDLLTILNKLNKDSKGASSSDQKTAQGVAIEAILLQLAKNQERHDKFYFSSMVSSINLKIIQDLPPQLQQGVLAKLHIDDVPQILKDLSRDNKVELRKQLKIYMQENPSKPPSTHRPN